MIIDKLECWPISLELFEPFQTATNTIQNFDNVILKATTDTGLTGWSCAAPDPGFNGETAETVLADFAETIEPLLKGGDPFRFAKYFQLLRTTLDDRRSALAMADMLLYDLMAKSARQPLYKFLGGFRDSIVTSVTIGIMRPDETVVRAKHLVGNGFRCLKLKGGLEVRQDIEKTHGVRTAVGAEIGLRFDGNQGYSLADTLVYVRQTSAANVQFIEQPIPTRLEHDMATIVRKTEIPIMVDEGLAKLPDAFRLVREKKADMFNIKLMRVGGITEAAQINAVARSAAVPCMVGSLEESELGIAFGLHFCLSRPNLVYADLDGAMDIRQDPFRGLISVKQGSLFPVGDYGIGNPVLD